MQTRELVGIWKLESNAGKQPAEDNIKTGLREFKDDGTFIDVTETLSPVPGFVPGSIHRLRGVWKLDENILEQTFPEGSFEEGTSPVYTHKSMVAIDGDTLEIAALQYYDRGANGKYNVEKEHIGIFVYRRINTS